jgi:putative peptidoglycan binding protein
MNFAELDVAIGLSLVYLVLSLLCSSIQEAISSYRGWRASTLEQGIRNLLQKQPFSNPHGEPSDLADAVYAHPLVNALAPGETKPSYIAGRTFAQALLGVLHASAGTDGTLAALPRAIAALPNGDVRAALQTFVLEAGDDVAAIRANIERWFDDTMERVSGWYKRHVTLALRIIAVVVAVGMNVDTIRIVTALREIPALREGAVASARDAVANRDSLLTPRAREARDAELEQTLKRLDLPMGLPTPWWPSVLALVSDKTSAASSRGNEPPTDESPQLLEGEDLAWAILSTVVGWFITAAALSLGAPFWFDTLNKLLNLRSAGPKPQREDEKAATTGMTAADTPQATQAAIRTSDSLAPPATGPQNDFETKRLSDDDIRDIQRRLGIFDHVVPGTLDAPTREAIKRAQTNLGLEATGRLSEALTTRLLYTASSS